MAVLGANDEPDPLIQRSVFRQDFRNVGFGRGIVGDAKFPVRVGLFAHALDAPAQPLGRRVVGGNQYRHKRRARQFAHRLRRLFVPDDARLVVELEPDIVIRRIVRPGPASHVVVQEIAQPARAARESGADRAKHELRLGAPSRPVLPPHHEEAACRFQLADPAQGKHWLVEFGGNDRGVETQRGRTGQEHDGNLSLECPSHRDFHRQVDLVVLEGAGTIVRVEAGIADFSLPGVHPYPHRVPSGGNRLSLGNAREGSVIPDCAPNAVAVICAPHLGQLLQGTKLESIHGRSRSNPLQFVRTRRTSCS